MENNVNNSIAADSRAGMMERITDFTKKYKYIVDRYNCIPGVLPLNKSYNDILDLYDKLVKVSPDISLTDALKMALNNAINYNINIGDSFESIIASGIPNEGQLNTIQKYFKEVGDIYEKNGNNYKDIEFCPENRNKLIEMNLKTVISIAKRYQGLGLSLEELISAGNLGLVTAFDKFDPSRATLRDNIISAVETLPDSFSHSELVEVIKPFLAYGDVKTKFMSAFRKKNAIYNKSDVISWVKNNIHKAVFNSICHMWIRAFILIEIDNHSRLVKKPKSEILKDKSIYGSYKKEVTVDIDGPAGPDSDTSLADILVMEDDSRSDLDTAEAYDVFKRGLKTLLDGVKTRDRKIFLKKFGIGLPRPMSPSEIAEQEGLSIARVSQICQDTLEAVQKNQMKYNIDKDILFEAVRGLH